jgi:hypothetical protein
MLPLLLTSPPPSTLPLLLLLLLSFLLLLLLTLLLLRLLLRPYYPSITALLRPCLLLQVDLLVEEVAVGKRLQVVQVLQARALDLAAAGWEE